jgi:hypothetical protein
MSRDTRTLLDRVSPRRTHYSASDLGISAVDLKAAADTVYKSNIVDLRGAEGVYLYTSWDVGTDAGSTGQHKIQWEILDDDDVAIRATQHDLTTALNNLSSGEAALAYVPTEGILVDGYAAATGAGIFVAAPRGRFVVYVVAQSDANDANLSAQLILTTRGQESPTEL